MRGIILYYSQFYLQMKETKMRVPLNFGIFEKKKKKERKGGKKIN